jgi:hypothetical protein
MKTFALASLALLPHLALAQGQLDVSTPQLEMIKRVSAAAERHAQKLGLNNEVLSYCQIELSNKTNQLPRDGLYPFGVNYNNIKTAQELERVISAREAYEKTFLLLCLSRAKRDLQQD